jgi:hypothetical protein
LKEPISHTVEEAADLKTAVSTEEETEDKRRKINFGQSRPVE